MNYLNTHYFVAILPEKDQQELITNIKKDIALRYNTKAALKSPPHITLQPPFHWNEKEEFSLINQLKGFCLGYSLFQVSVNGFDAFKPRVIYVKVNPNMYLNSLHTSLRNVLTKNLNISNTLRKNRHYHPHITVAFSDLNKDDFWKAWSYYRDKNLCFSFDAKHITLLKHNGEKWDTYVNFPLAN